MTTLNAAQIQAALQKLDVSNDNHWTADGLPRLDTVKMLAGDQSLTRELVTQAAPGFSRAVAAQGGAPIVPPAPPAAVADPAATPPEGATPPPPPAPPSATPEVKVQPVSTTAETGLPNQSLALINALAAPKPPVDISALEARLAVLTEELAQITRAEVEIKKERTVRQLEADDIVARIGAATPRDDNQQGIMDYLASQNAKLVRRGEQIARVKEVESELGVKLGDLVPKRSPLDTAMARKTGYGRNRPGG